MDSGIDSNVKRQNILNNKYVVDEARKFLDINGILFDGVFYFTNKQLADLYEVDIRTIERIISNYREELEKNGYRVLSGKELKGFKDAAQQTDIDVGLFSKSIGVSTFRTVLNFSMLLTNSKVAKAVRSKLLDIAMNYISEKTGGDPKYINQRDRDYLSSAFIEESERRKFTDAIKNYVDGNNFKYANLTNEVYLAIFKEKAKEYREILKLEANENPRSTMYSEVLTMIASFEAGLAYEFEEESKRLDRPITYDEARAIINKFASHPGQKPLLNNVRTKMASRDYGFRDATHLKLKEYITPLTEEEYEKFLGEQSKSLEEQIEGHKEVFKRLRDK